MILPEDFIKRTKNLIGLEWEGFEKSLCEESPVSIRFNPNKAEDISILDLPLSEKVEWASNAYYLNFRPVFTLDPLFHAGVYYVQEASSMYLEQIAKKYLKDACKVLDLCAAPGGKSTHLSSLLPKSSLLVANEVIRSRSYILAENLIKWGNPNTIVTNNDPKEIGKLFSFFDLILADVPCSGEGMFRKDPNAASEWSVNNVKLCSERQKRIIADCWSALKPEGILIYSTCTYNREENEENLEWICENLGAEIVDPPKRFFPHKTKGEGFFIAAIRKRAGNDERRSESGVNAVKRKQIHNTHSKETLHELQAFIRNPESFVFVSENNQIRAIPEGFYWEYSEIKNKLKVVFAGIDLGELKGKSQIPNHGLAMSNQLSQSAFPCWDVDKEIALHFLRKESFVGNIPDNIPKGYVLIRYRGQTLGFIKNIGNRANNLYPQEWRIRMSQSASS